MRKATAQRAAAIYKDKESGTLPVTFQASRFHTQAYPYYI